MFCVRGSSRYVGSSQRERCVIDGFDLAARLACGAGCQVKVTAIILARLMRSSELANDAIGAGNHYMQVLHTPGHN